MESRTGSKFVTSVDYCARWQYFPGGFRDDLIAQRWNETYRWRSWIKGSAACWMERWTWRLTHRSAGRSWCKALIHVVKCVSACMYDISTTRVCVTITEWKKYPIQSWHVHQFLWVKHTKTDNYADTTGAARSPKYVSGLPTKAHNLHRNHEATVKTTFSIIHEWIPQSVCHERYLWTVWKMFQKALYPEQQ